MTVDLLAYTYVAPGKEPEKCRFVSAIDADLQEYLEKHVDNLHGRAERGSSAEAKVAASDSKKRLRQLQQGPEEEFRQAAQAFADELQEGMPGTAKPGFFVALRRSFPKAKRPEAAILKLEVAVEVAAVVRHTKDGEELATVRDLLDLHGGFQKGAVFPDSRLQSDIIVGDKATEAALYFLRTLGADQRMKPNNAAIAFMSLIARISPHKVETVGCALAQLDGPVSVKAFIKELANILTDAERKELRMKLKEQRRRIETMDPKRLKMSVRADGIEVRGPASQMCGNANITQVAQGFVIQVTTLGQPRITFGRG